MRSNAKIIQLADYVPHDYRPIRITADTLKSITYYHTAGYIRQSWLLPPAGDGDSPRMAEMITANNSQSLNDTFALVYPIGGDVAPLEVWESLTAFRDKYFGGEPLINDSGINRARWVRWKLGKGGANV